MGRLVNPYQQFRDASGVPVDSGTLTFTVNGDTNTQKNIYSDQDLTTEQSNPYPLDGSGRVIGDIWLDGEYSVVLKDSDGATIRTYNDVEDFSSSSGGGGSEVVTGSYLNKFVNGSCRVPSVGGSVSISASYQEGGVRDIYAKAQGTPTNGTVDQTKSTLAGTTGYVLGVNDLTTGGGGTVDLRIRFAAADSKDLVNQAAVFQFSAYQNTGASKTYTISIYKATAEDNFASTTLISASSGTSVSDLTKTVVFHPVADMGDCSNGIEVIVSCACGAVTTKDFYFGDFSFRKGQAQITYEQIPFRIARAAYSGPLPPEYIDGMRIESDTDADHDIKVNTGSVRDAADSANIVLSSIITKRLDAAWSAGDDAGGLPTGVTLSGPEWLYFFVIMKDDGTADAGWDDNASATNLLADATGYLYYRHIGSTRTDGSDNIDHVLYNPDIGVVPVEQYFTSTGSNTFYWPPLVRSVLFEVIGGGGGGGGGSNGTAGTASYVTYNSVTATAGGGGFGSTGSVSPGSGGTGSGTYDVTVPGADGDADSPNGRGVRGGESPWGWGHGGDGVTSAASTGYGSGGYGRSGDSAGGAGGGVRVRKAYVSGQETATVYVGAGGTAGSSAGAGRQGIAVARW